MATMELAGGPEPEQTNDDGDLSLWTRFAEGDGAAREALLLRHLDWARGVARSVFMRVRGRSDDWHDFVQNATLGLIEAMRGFDPLRRIDFRCYAGPRVRGAVFNGLRALRTVAQTSLSTSEALADLLDEPIDDPVERLVAMVSGLAVGHALAIDADWVTQPSRDTPYESAMRSQLGERLSRHLARLSDNERRVIVWHYVQYMPFVRIAELLGISKGRVSQLHRQGMARLRERMMHDRWQLTL